MSNQKKQLIEEVGIIIEERADLTPLAARIYALLILSPYEGLSFDQIVTMTNASKSSVSSSVNVLVQLHYVEYYTKSGDRRRYFRTSKYYLKNTLEQHRFSIDKELKVIQKINAYNKINNPEKFKNEKSVGILFENYLKDQRQKIDLTLKEIDNFKENS